ncbi:hypothetical protein GCM10018775_23420 [Streptomyces umbrinus]|nr:hypothetical protein GCM10018775_23420 [Streptomyces umbrinus]
MGYVGEAERILAFNRFNNQQRKCEGNASGLIRPAKSTWLAQMQRTASGAGGGALAGTGAAGRRGGGPGRGT